MKFGRWVPIKTRRRCAVLTGAKRCMRNASWRGHAWVDRDTLNDFAAEVVLIECCSVHGSMFK